VHAEPRWAPADAADCTRVGGARVGAIIRTRRFQETVARTPLPDSEMALKRPADAIDQPHAELAGMRLQLDRHPLRGRAHRGGGRTRLSTLLTSAPRCIIRCFLQALKQSMSSSIPCARDQAHPTRVNSAERSKNLSRGKSLLIGTDARWARQRGSGSPAPNTVASDLLPGHSRGRPTLARAKLIDRRGRKPGERDSPSQSTTE
jgi:hypothetical protein